MVYFTLNWKDASNQIIFNSKAQNLPKALKFIDTALQKGDSVLVHSVRGQSRSCCLVLAYLIHRYRWTLDKSLQFLIFRRPNVDIRPHFVRQLRAFEESVRVRSELSGNWTGFVEDSEELVLRNTYLNSMQQKAEAKAVVNKERKVKWADEEKKVLVTVIARQEKQREVKRSEKMFKTPEKRTDGLIDLMDELERLSKTSGKKSTPVKPKGQSSHVTSLSKNIPSVAPYKKISFPYDEYLKDSPYKKLLNSQNVKLHLSFIEAEA